ncbi:MAG: SPOR domain-containing protein, partial [Terriglobales bacterium]
DSSELSAISSTGGAKPTPARTPPPVETPAETPAATAAGPQAQTPPKTDAAAPELRSTPATGFMVQVAAVSKQEDAEALVAALRKKQYPVLVVNNIPNSPYYHMQVGPFSQQKDAEAMRTKLASDGYNAILKK